MAHLSRGAHTHQIPLRLFQKNRARLCEHLKANSPTLPANAAVVLQGGVETTRYATDVNPPAFRQESFFFWAFGVPLESCYGAIDVASGKSLLFVPEPSEAIEVWCGKSPTLEQVKRQFEVDYVYYVHQLNDILAEMGVNTALLLQGDNTDSGETHQPAKWDGMEKFKLDYSLLFPSISECRVFKSDEELKVLKYICEKSSDAHKAMMRNAKRQLRENNGLYEYQNESYFLFHTSYYAGSRHCAYTCIAGSGENCAILHYGHAGEPNSRKIKDGDLCLCDMGGEYFCYGADITTTFPVNGQFTADQKLIYNAVLDANQAVMNAAKPGVSWIDMHQLAERTILKHLVAGGLLQGDIEEMMKCRLCAVFMPHGLGHFLGLDVHDVGGYNPPAPARSTLPGLKSLRTTRVLQERMFITIEPGCYFQDVLLDRALADPVQSKFINKARLDEFRGTGGVRIEDDVLITADGCENYSIVPRTVEEIEAFMAKDD